MYSDGDNTTWFKQSLLTHKDKMYGTDGYFQVAIATYTEDYQFFGPPYFTISISNNYRKNYNISFQNACDLIRTFDLVKEQMQGDKCEIQRKYQKNMNLFFQFFIEDNNNEPVVSIQIFSNETDFTKVIMPIAVFNTFARCLRYYVDNYFNICTQLLNQTIQYESIQIIKQLPGLIKGISSNLNINQDDIKDHHAPEPKIENIEKAVSTIEDLDKFIGGDDMKNIKVPEIIEEKAQQKKIVEVDSIFTRFFLKNDLSNLEDMINNHVINKNTLGSIANDIDQKIGPEVDGDFTVLPDISEDDKKSLIYTSKMYYTMSHYAHFNSNKPLPSSVPILKYKPENIQSINIDIALDLLLYNIYIKSMRSRLEGKITDSIQNKSIFHTQFRFFTDAFVFSILDNHVDIDTIPSLILARFKYYRSVGVFDKYDKLIEKEKCPEILEHEINFAANEVTQKVINQSPLVEALHQNSYENGHLALPYKNQFDLEQILNEVIPTELFKKSGRDLNSPKVIEELQSKYTISQEVFKLVLEENIDIKKTKSPKKESTSTVSTKFGSNLERVVNFYSDEIPVQYKKSFMKYVEGFKDKPFDLSDGKFPYDEFDDKIIKALYLWNPSDDPKILNSYKHYQVKIEDELMEKDLILAKMNTEDSNQELSDEWNFSL